jgi:hypothetical protein
LRLVIYKKELPASSQNRRFVTEFAKARPLSEPVQSSTGSEHTKSTLMLLGHWNDRYFKDFIKCRKFQFKAKLIHNKG